MNQQARLACPHLVAPVGRTLQLVGSRCTHCGEIYFPSCHACTRCSHTQFEVHPLGAIGILWSWTLQGFLPKPPYNSGETEASFKPYGVGYVEMPSGIKIESRLIADDIRRLHIGMPMHLTLENYRTDDQGQSWSTFAFSADGENSHAQ
jgi:uncharacterized OB-fold protein